MESNDCFRERLKNDFSINHFVDKALFIERIPGEFCGVFLASACIDTGIGSIDICHGFGKVERSNELKSQRHSRRHQIIIIKGLLGVNVANHRNKQQPQNEYPHTKIEGATGR
eukprot:Lithocolla_globosa_v1_NODE_1541_length_2496_cov_46.810324.p4 type:complete len:113 gc:universal NODE_1541_length_2496_cov_46.810324:953-615(-)